MKEMIIQVHMQEIDMFYHMTFQKLDQLHLTKYLQ